MSISSQPMVKFRLYKSSLTPRIFWSLPFCILTVRKRSLRRLCFYTCLSFRSQGGVCLSACWDTHPPPSPGPEASTPLDQRQTPPWHQRQRPLSQAEGRHPSRPDIPWSRHPTRAVHAGRYGQQVGGTHPTGMHTCYNVNLFQEMLNKTDDRGYSAIQWATCMFPLDTDVDGRKLKTVKVLHEAGIDINHQDNKNRTGR